LYAHPVAEWIKEKTGLSIPDAEFIMSYISFILPLLAAVATLYLYHRVYLSSLINAQRKKYELIRAAEEERIPIDWKGYVAIAFLLFFIPAVLYAGYISRFADNIPAPIRYREIAHLSNLDLRNRAFSVSQKIRDLFERYDTRRHEVNVQYDKAMAKFTDENSRYEKAKAEYNAACPSGQFTLSTRPLILGTPADSWPNTLDCMAKAVPQPPPKPSYPEVSVDQEWSRRAKEVQEEAAAVWGELYHRLGTYPKFFDLPTNYNPDATDIRPYGNKLENIANQLH
jgi:hypothetical protein